MLLPTQTNALLLLLVAAGAARAEDKPVPEYLHICKRNDPQLVDCIKQSIENLRPKMATGMPELNVPPLEPLYLQQLVLNENPSLRVVANDIEAYKTTTFEIRDLQVDYNKGEYSFHLSFPSMNIVGKYSVDGRILLLPVKGSGPLKLNITDVQADVDLRSEIVERDGERYLSLKSLKVNIDVGSGSIRLENLFGGDRILGEVVNAAVNANFDNALYELKPSVEGALQKSLGEITQKILSSYPVRQLFPEK